MISYCDSASHYFFFYFYTSISSTNFYFIVVVLFQTDFECLNKCREFVYGTMNSSHRATHYTWNFFFTFFQCTWTECVSAGYKQKLARNNLSKLSLSSHSGAWNISYKNCSHWKVVFDIERKIKGQPVWNERIKWNGWWSEGKYCCKR